MSTIKNTNEVEVTIKTFYKEQIIKLDIGKCMRRLKMAIWLNTCLKIIMNHL